MNRRQALQSLSLTAGAVSMLRTGRLFAQQRANATSTEGDTILVHPANGSDTNSGAKTSPLRTLAEAARRVNASTGEGAMTVVLAEGIHTIAETTLLGPEHRVLSKAARLTIRAEVQRSTSISPTVQRFFEQIALVNGASALRHERRRGPPPLPDAW